MTSAIGSSSGWASQLLNAASASERHASMFKKLDTNGDGKIDASELQAAQPKDGKGKDAAAIMKEADTNGDGSIDSSENDAFLTKLESQRTANGSAQAGGTPPSGGPPPGGGPHGGGGSKTGSTSSSSSSTSTVYDVRDTNKDGKVSFEEMLAALEKESEQTTVTGTDDSSSDSQTAFLKKLEEQMNRLTQDVQTYSGLGTSSDTALGTSFDRMG
jgi:Ca2+-binding EF-hand superfamily protein